MRVDSSLEVVIDINGLESETEYVLYVYGEDRGGNYNGNPGFLIFNTAIKYRTAEVTFKFNQEFLSGPEKELLIRTVAFKLSLPYEKVQEKKFDPTSLTRRNLVAENQCPKRRLLQTTTMITLYIVPVNDNPNYPKP